MPETIQAIDGTPQEYARIHHWARKRLGCRCIRCESAVRLQAALRPNAPEDRLRVDPRTACAYSIDLGDYETLCTKCHRQQDLVEMRTHCANGHEYIPQTTSIRTDGSRRCLICHREQEATRKAARGARFEHGESGY